MRRTSEVSGERCLLIHLALAPPSAEACRGAFGPALEPSARGTHAYGLSPAAWESRHEAGSPQGRSSGFSPGLRMTQAFKKAKEV